VRAQHIPVLCDEVVEYLATWRGGLFVDCTLGLGGHAAALLESSPGLRLIGIDRDEQALGLARERLAHFRDRVRLVLGNFSGLGALLRAEGVEAVDGVLADLGVSSLQLDTAERGFSFRLDGPLDMRMGRTEMTAADVVNGYGEERLRQVFAQYGEERQARRIARAVVKAREGKPIETTRELQEIVARAKGGGAAAHRRKIDPATRVFQAIRIEVNEELKGLEALLQEAVRLLETDGRLVVISYHSLEDRIVKNTLRTLARGEVDEVTGRTRSETQAIEVLTRKPVRPTADEVAANPRARSAKLRAARRL
jgi:16S rRNA (cytosine1402-N4)-methyltransferase